MVYLESENLLDHIEILGCDSAILMSFLDEQPQMEYCDDDEKLTSLIQSLEAEIEYPNIKDDRILDDNTIQNLNFIDNSSLNFYYCEDNICTRSAPDDGEDSFEELIDIDDFSWMDMEMSYLTYCTSYNQVGSEYYSQIFTCIPIEEEVYDSLWLRILANSMLRTFVDLLFSIFFLGVRDLSNLDISSLYSFLKMSHTIKSTIQ